MRVLFLIFLLSSFPALAFDHEHTALGKVLEKKLVSQGSDVLVDYRSLKKNSSTLDSYLQALSKIQEKEFKAWSREQRLATLINAYNAWTLKLIIDHYPVKSIKDIGSLFSSPWKKEFIPWLGKKITLDEIEHERIRPVFNEPRVHFALVCASKGCPPLRKIPYTGKNLEEMLEANKLAFLRNEKKNTYRLEGKKLTLQVSTIFKWFTDDFGGEEKLKSYLLEGMGLTEKARGKSIEIDFLDYDWSLNEA
jgi:hypothetical protein